MNPVLLNLTFMETVLLSNFFFIFFLFFWPEDYLFTAWFSQNLHRFQGKIQPQTGIC